MPSAPAVTSVLPSRLRLMPTTPGFRFFGNGGAGRQRATVCAEHAEVQIRKRTAMNMENEIVRVVAYFVMNFATPLMNICTASITSSMPINRSMAISPRSFSTR